MHASLCHVSKYRATDQRVRLTLFAIDPRPAIERDNARMIPIGGALSGIIPQIDCPFMRGFSGCRYRQFRSP